MSSLTDAFKEYGAKPPRKDGHSAVGAGGEIIVCLWERHFRSSPAPEKGLRYQDHFSKWPDGPSKAELREHLELALAENRAVRLIVGQIQAAKAADPYLAGQRANPAKKTYDVRKDLVGKVVTVTDDLFVIDFHKVPAVPAH